MAQEKGGGEMSPIQFRELDDEFMQKQAKVWLEALLEERYGEGASLADLLADGDILFRVSKFFKDLIRTSSGGDAAFPRLPFSEISSVSDGKGGRYLPYSHVDSFLKICKRIGLPDVDLFTPPDVVEKKDLRRVCFCIRALSKKARSQNLPVPDFDKVAHAIPMPPTEKVGGIRESLQQAAVASSSPDYRSPRTQQPVGRVLSNPNLVGSAFLESPPSIKQQPSSSSGESEEPATAKFEDETGSSELPEEEDKQSISASVSSSQVDETEEDEEPENSTEELEKNPELVIDKEAFHAPQPDEQQCCYEEEGPPAQRSGSSGFVLPFVLGAVALVVSVLAVVALKRPRKTSDYYVVKEGDTLSKISRTYGVGPWTELVDKNPSLATNPDLIYPTDRLKLV